MSVYNFKSKTYANLFLASQEEYINRNITIHFNETENMSLPLSLVLAISPHFIKQFSIDPTITNYFVNVDFLDASNKYAIVEKIESILNLKEVTLNSSDVINLALFGKAIGNKSFIAPFITDYQQIEANLSTDNVIDLLQKIIAFDIPPKQCDNILKFIAEHFSALKDNIVNLK